MKTFTSVLIVSMLCLMSVRNYAINPISPEAYNLTTITVNEYLDMDFKQLKSLSAQELKFKDRVGFLVTKRYLKHQLENDKIERSDNFITASDGFKFSFGGFLLGFLLGLLGLIIVAVAFKKPRKNAVLSALIGMLVSGVLAGVVYSI